MCVCNHILVILSIRIVPGKLPSIYKKTTTNEYNSTLLCNLNSLLIGNIQMKEISCIRINRFYSMNRLALMPDKPVQFLYYCLQFQLCDKYIFIFFFGKYKRRCLFVCLFICFFFCFFATTIPIIVRKYVYSGLNETKCGQMQMAKRNRSKTQSDR